MASQVTVDNPNGNDTTPRTTTGAAGPTGPLAALDDTKYKSNAGLRYPIDVSSYKSYLQFQINIPERSGYTKTLSQAIGGFGGVANANREEFGTVNALGAAEAAIVAGGAGIISTVKTAAGGLGMAAMAAKSAPRLVKGIVVGGAALAGLKGAVTGASVDKVLGGIKLGSRTKRLAQAIFLYVPETMTSQLVNQYDSTSLTEAMGTAGAIGEGIAAAGKSLSGEAGENSTFGAGVMAEAAAKIAQGAGTGDLSGFLLKSNGLAINPRIEVLYKSTANREFQFDFKFTPKNQKEMEQVLNIIKAFRFHAAPEMIDPAAGQRYLIPPSEFDITLWYDGSINTAFPKISTCVLEGIDVNYASGGQWATHEDGTPIEISMQLRFKETEILHKALIEKGF